MKLCHTFQSQMLDCLYGLLDETESQVLRAHVGECSACTSALARTEEQKRLLATAAKVEFPAIRFGVIPIAAARERRPQKQLNYGRQAQWTRWAVAAAVLFVLGGLGFGTTTYFNERNRVTLAEARTKQAADEIDRITTTYEAEIRQASDETANAQAEWEQLLPLAQQQMTLARQEVNSRPLRMSISGPPTVEAGGVNEYQVQVYNVSNQPVPAQITAELHDAQTHQLISKLQPAPGANRGAAKLSLPRDVPLAPGSDLHLIVKAKGENGITAELTEKLKLVAPVYLTHLATDKPMYQPGETVHFRSLSLERFSLRPAAEDLRLQYAITVPTGGTQPVVEGAARVSDGETGLPLLGPDKQPIRGVGAGEYLIDADASGGEYTLSVSELNGRFPPQLRKFIVNRYQKPRLNKELEFTRKSYGPGDEVVAACKVASAEGGAALVRQSVIGTLKVDNQPPQTTTLQTDANGGVMVKFQLPANIERGDGTLAVEFTDGGNVETIAKPIPIVLQKLRVEFFPEGGELVAGVPNRVYFQARTLLDKPAELTGRIVDDGGHIVTTAETFNEPTQPGANQGMGRFELTPEAGKTYELQIDSPVGIKGKYVLPEAKTDGVVLTVPTGVTRGDEPIQLIVHGGNQSRRLLVGAYCRGRLMAHERTVAVPGKPAEITLRPPAGIGGVFRVTVFEELAAHKGEAQLIPRAERLIYHVPAHRLNLKVEADKPVYVPGDKVALSYNATDENGQAVPGIVMVSVVDSSVVKLADEKTFRTMPTHFLLTTEVRRPEDLEHADFLLTDHAKAAAALDLMLGVQGWRRFVEQSNPEEIKQRNLDEPTQLAVRTGRMTAALTPKTSRSAEMATLEVLEGIAANKSKLEDRLARSEVQLDEVTAKEQQIAKQVSTLREVAAVAEFDVNRSQERVAEYLQLARNVVLPIGASVLLLVCILCVVVGLRRGRAAGMIPYAVAASASFLMMSAALVYVWTVEVAAPKSVRLEMNSTLSAGTPLSNPADATRPQDGPGEAAPALMGDGKGGVRVIQPAPEAARPAGQAGARAPLAKANDDDAKAKGRRENLGIQNRDRNENQPAAARVARVESPLGMRGKDVQAAKKFNAAPQEKVLEGRRQLRKLDDRADRLAPGRGLKEFKQANARAELAPISPPPVGGKAMKDEEFRGGRALHFDKNVAAGRYGEAFLLHSDLFNPAPPLIVREYGHLRPRGEADVRSDDTETIYWHPVLVLPDGKGASSFELADSVTTFQVLVSGHTLDGRLGSVTADIAVRKPLSVEPKLPIEVTANDKIDVALTVANGTDVLQSVDLNVKSTNAALVGSPGTAPMSLTPRGRARRVYRFQPTVAEGDADLRFDARAGVLTDSVLRTFKVVPEGFPIAGTQSDMLEKTARHELTLPDTWLPGTLKYQVTAYPSTLADLQKGLEALLREPNGCFEQTSTTNYPNVLILGYLKETDQAKPDIARRAQDLLTNGYRRLTSFECSNASKNACEGYEWFGGTAPPHEALTAYGLMQFRDMARVHDVDPQMIERTKAYLMSRRDGKGGFLRNPKSLDSFGRAPEHITNAYIVWALTESSQDDDVAVELAALSEQADTSADPYFLALVANSLLNRERTDDALVHLKKLIELQKSDGHFDAGATSITGSGGRDLQIETTALCVLAWLKAKRPDQFNVAIQKSIYWIGQQRGGGGGFGSTQSTILTMKALLAYARENKKTAEAGELVLYVDDAVVASKSFAAGAEEAIAVELPAPEKLLKPGKNHLRVEMVGKSIFPYTAAWTYNSLKPLSGELCPIGLKTSLERGLANEGETVGLKVQVENNNDKGQAMTVAVVGLPAGLTLPEDMKRLKDLARLRNDGTERGVIDSWEIRGRELVLYWRDMAPRQKIEVNLELICRVPGEYRGPASRAYLYYNADHKCWVEPLRVEIKSKVE